jgi:alpha-N-acetylglucosamine transferase
MRESGCCGADEFIKLHAYTLTDYHRVVHLDMDSIIYKNMVGN